MARRSNLRGTRQLIDSLRSQFILSLDAGDELDKILGAFDHAVSETLLDLLDAPAPPNTVRKRQPKPAPIVARPPKGRRRGLPKVNGGLTLAQQEDASKQASIDDVVGNAVGQHA